jgi:DNA invertase Pin-like site-specific DNA recombinase
MKEGIVGLYARVSTLKKQDYTRQINELKEIILQHGYSENQIEIYKEKVSGYKKKDDRPQLSLLLSKIRKEPQKYKCLYTSEISRIGREPKNTREIVDELSELGVPIFIQSLGQFTLQEGKRNMIMSIILQVLIEFSNFESETFKDRSKSGLLKSARDGKVGGGKYLPYGFKKGMNKMLEVNSEESKVIELIFTLYQEGHGIKVISNMLNDQSIPTRTNISFDNKLIMYKVPKSTSQIRWSDKQIHDILKNPIYMGKRRFKGELLSVPNIVSEETYNLCNEILKTKNTRNTTTIYTYLLKDLIKCGVCGRNYFGRFKPVLGGDKIYKCSSTLIKGSSCKNKGVNIKFIESVIFNDIVNSYNLERIFSESNQVNNQLKKRRESLEMSIPIEESTLLKKHTEVERLLDLYIKSSIDLVVYEKKNRQLSKEISNIETKINIKKKELKKINISDERLNVLNPTPRIIRDSKDDRIKLWSIFKQIIDKIIFNIIDEKMCVFTLFTGMDLGTGYKPRPHQYVLDLEYFRKTRNFKYKSGNYLKFDSNYDERNILLTDLDKIQIQISLNESPWKIVDNQNIVEMTI